MSSLFKTYEDDYVDLTSSINKDIDELKSSLPDGDGKMATVPGVNRLQRLSSAAATYDKLRALVNNMEFESNDIPIAQRQQVKERVAEYKRSLFNTEKEMARLKKECSQLERDELLQGRPTSVAASAEEIEANKHRVQLASNTQKMKNQTDKLRAAERLVNDADNMADESLQELDRQGNVIKKVGQTTTDTDDEVNQSRRITNRMHQVMIQNKALLIVIILMLSIMIIVIIYVKYIRTDPATVVTAAPTYAIDTSIPEVPTTRSPNVHS